MSIASEILALIADRNGIRNALVNKGVPTAANHGYDDFAEDISSIPTGGTYQSKSVRYTTNGARTITPDSGYDALSSVSVNVDVSGEEPNLQAKSVTPTKNGMTVVADAGYDGLSQVTVAGDNNLIAGNIKKDVTIFGVNGTYQGPPHTPQISVSPSGLITSACGGSSTTHQLSSADDADFIASNIKKDVTIFGINGSYQGTGDSGNGSLIVVSFSSNITSIKAKYSVGGVTVERFADLYTSLGEAYVTIPHDVPAGTEVTLNGYRSGTIVAFTTVVINGVNKYTCQLSFSAVIYESGVWHGVGEHTWIGASEYSPYVPTELNDSIECNGYYSRWYGDADATGATLSIGIPTLGYRKIRVTVRGKEGGTAGYSFYAFGYARSPIYCYWIRRESSGTEAFQNMATGVIFNTYLDRDIVAEADIDSSDSIIYIVFLGSYYVKKIEYV